MYYLIDNDKVNAEELEFKKNGKPCFDYIEASEDLDELREMKENIIYNEAYVYVKNKLDYEPETNQFNENVNIEAEDHFSIIDNDGNILEE